MINKTLEKIKELDKENYLGSIQNLPNQISQTWEETKSLNIPASFRDVKNIIVCGMGGSGLGPHIIKSLYSKELKIPFEIIKDYTLPGYINSDSLVICSSYFGQTEEIIAVAQEAKKREAKIIGFSSGGKLQEVLDGYPFYKFQPKYNPCKQPRAGLGYSIVGLLAILDKLEFIKIDDQDIKNVVTFLKKRNEHLSVEASVNPALRLADTLQGKIATIVGARFLTGNAHTFANQLNETSKTYATWFVLPELNHHLLEGLEHPKNKSLIFVFLDSNLYDKRIDKRIKATKKVLGNLGIGSYQFEPNGETKLIQSFECLLFSSYASFYLAIREDVNPSLIPWVNYFKEQLSKT